MYNIGVIGTGVMGKNHIRVLKNMSDKFNLVGVYDKDIDNMKQVSLIYDVNYFTDLNELLNKIDTVIIAAPSSLHKELSIKCISKGINIFIEKPISLSIDDGYEVLKIAKETNLICMVGHIERFNPVTDELIKVLDLEDILSIDIHRLSPFDTRIFDTDVALDLMIHDIDLLLAFINDDIMSIKSEGIKVYSNQYDYVQTLIRFNRNIVSSLTASRITEDKKRLVEINTKNAFITADYLNRTINITRKTKFSLDVGYSLKYKQENIQEKVFVPMKEPLLAELEHFYNCIKNKSKPKTNLESSIKALEVCRKIVDKIGE